ncbi:MAG: MFS transporter, partial [Anaerolineae bacterium]|nr:MFS transporter [Anaerolineae bacterium]
MPAEPETPSEEAVAASNLTLLSVRTLLAGLRGSVLTVILQPFVLALGASVAYLGWLEALGGYRGLVPTLVLPAAGWLADRVGRKWMLVSASVFAVASLLLMALSSLERNALLLTPAIVLLGLNAIGRPAIDALVVESARRGRVGYAYGQFSFAWATAGVIASLGGGYVADRFGFTPVFLGATALELVAIFVLILGVRETLVTRRRARLPRRELPRLAVRLLTGNQRLPHAQDEHKDG